ncbi:MAG: TonB-dependent receptor [Candidatus Eisenbacteria bacterium]
MRNPVTRTLAIFLLIGVLPALCSAGIVGKIAGKVSDKETGESLQFANVVVIDTPMGAMSLADGLFAILNVTPGTYDVQASFMGYKPVRISGVVVKPDLTVMVEFELEKTVVEVVDPIIIRAERPIVEVDVTSTRHIMTADEVDALPIDNPVNIVNFISGSSVDARGTHIRGGRDTEVGYYIDNSPITDPIENNSMLNLSTQSVNELVVFTGGFNAEYGNASSGIINIITTEGTNDFKGSYEHRMYLPVEMFWRHNDGGDPLDTGEIRERFNLSGPVFKKADSDLRFAASVEGTNWDDYDPRVEALDRPGKQRLYNGTLTYRRGRTKIKGVFNAENQEYVDSYDGQRLYERILVPETWRNNTIDNYRVALSGSHMVTDRSFVEASFSVLDGTLEIAQPGKGWDPELSEFDNQVKYDWDLDTRRDANNFIISGDMPYYDYQEKRVYSFRGAYTHQRGRNEIKTGLDLNMYDVLYNDVFASTDNYYIYTYDVSPMAGALYAQDKLEFEGLIMNLGLRLDFFDPSHKVFKDYDHPFDPALPADQWHGPDGNQAPIEVESYDSTGAYAGGGLVDADVKWKLSPRLGASHPITENTYLHFLYGHFFQMPSFDYLYENEKFHTRGRWLRSGNADLEAEKTVAYEVGFNHLLSKNTAVDVTFFYKDITDMVETVTRGPFAESNPQAEENYVTYMNSGYGNVRGFEINLKRPHFQNWHYHAAYTFMVAKGFSSDWDEGYLRRFDDEEFPTQQFYLDWDRRHSFLITGGYGKAKNWGADVSVSYATGAPFTHPLSLGKKPSRNSSRYPAISNVDAEVHKVFNILGLDTNVFVRATNLFDQRNLVNWDDVDQDLRNWLIINPGDYLGPFGDYTVYGPPRQVLGGFRVNF